LLALWAVTAACSADTAERHAEAVRRGDDFVSQQRDAEAIGAYREALQLDARDGRVRLKLARALYRTQQWAAAAAEGVRAADLLPGDREATLFGVQMMLSASRWADAAEWTKLLLTANPNDVDALVLSANGMARMMHSTWAIWRLGEAMRLREDVATVQRELRPSTLAADDRQAETRILRAVALDPAHVEARFALANFLWATGRLAESEPILRPLADELPSHWLANRALAQFYLTVGREKDAEAYLRVAAAHHDPDAASMLADLLLGQARDEEAIEVLDALAARSDPEGVAAARAAEVEVRLNQRDAANRRLDAILQRLPRQPHALRLRAELLLERNEHTLALPMAKAAVNADGRSADARVVLARALEATGDASGALEQFFQAYWLAADTVRVRTDIARLALILGQDRKAAEYADLAVRADPDDLEAALLLAQSLTRLGEFQRADEVIRPLRVRAPWSPRVWAIDGMARAARGDQAAARVAFQRALTLDPGDVEALTGLVDLELRLGGASEATRVVERALARSPRHPAYYRLRSRVAEAAGDRTGAERDLRQALEIDPRDTRAAVELGRLLSDQGRVHDAEALLTGSLQRVPSSLEARLALTDVFERTGRVADARAGYEAILAAHPREVRASTRLAAIYANEDGRVDTALTLAQQAKEDRPYDAEVSGVLGWVYLRKGLPALAVPHLRDAQAGAPEHGTYAFHLGLAYLRLNRRDDANRSLARAMVLSPSAPWVDEARRALATLSR
jgi:tetratricopeptide (TPR) repeat protein